MSSYNRVVLMGNMTRDPELSYTPANTAICEFGLAMNRSYKSKDGVNHDETCFVDCSVFGVRAEVVNKYFSKGSQILIEGRLKFDQWKAQDGTNRSKLRIVVEDFQFCSPKGQKQESNEDEY